MVGQHSADNGPSNGRCPSRGRSGRKEGRRGGQVEAGRAWMPLPVFPAAPPPPSPTASREQSPAIARTMCAAQVKRSTSNWRATFEQESGRPDDVGCGVRPLAALHHAMIAGAALAGFALFAADQAGAGDLGRQQQRQPRGAGTMLEHARRPGVVTLFTAAVAQSSRPGPDRVPAGARRGFRKACGTAIGLAPDGRRRHFPDRGTHAAARRAWLSVLIASGMSPPPAAILLVAAAAQPSSAWCSS